VLFSSSALTELLVRTVAKGGNLEINVGPTGDGRIPSSMQTPLRSVGRWLRVNGAAVYNTTAPSSGAPCEAAAGGGAVDRCYTQRVGSGGAEVFAILLGWPAAASLAFPRVAPTARTVVTLLGREDLGPLPFTAGAGGGLVVQLPGAAAVDALPCADARAFTLRFAGVAPAAAMGGGAHAAAAPAAAVRPVAAAARAAGGEEAGALACDWRAGGATDVRGTFSPPRPHHLPHLSTRAACLHPGLFALPSWVLAYR